MKASARSSLFVALAAAFAVALVGCGGGGTSVAPSNGSQTSAGPVNVYFTITVPKSTDSADRLARSVSPETLSVGIAQCGPPAPGSCNATAQFFNVSSGSCNSGCQIGPVGTTNGTIRFVINTWSGTNGSGNILDTFSVNETIAGGSNNTFNIALGPVVSSTADSGAGTLRDAIANAHSGDTIAFFVGGTNPSSVSRRLKSCPCQISLASTLPTISGKTLTITGPGKTQLTIGGTSPGSENVQLFNVSNTGNLTLDGMTLAYSTPTGVPGGAIYNNGTLTVGSTGSTSTIVFDHNTASPFAPNPARGGAIYNDTSGNLTVRAASFTNNSAGQGGAIYSAGTITVNSAGASFSGNAANTDGGAIDVASGTAAISNATFSTNQAATGGAIEFDVAPTTFSTNTFTSNSTGTAATGTGGAVAVEGALTVSETGNTYTSNSAGSASNQGQGGAVYTSGGTYTVSGSVFSGNSATGTSGATGGAIFASGGLVVQQSSGGNSTFDNNSATAQSNAGPGSACL
ncbi:MAG: hypothetical protein JO101_01130, partial [Candidatus Eremiobacteraeota bacterium]|nr:hypothetical protein [Candidatus Eremiobacteraeota bacterium]